MKNRRIFKIDNCISQFIVILVAAVVAIPLYFIFVSTFKTQADELASPMGIPLHPIITNYVNAINIMIYPNALKNNLIITVCSVILILLITAFAAYPLARRRNKLNNVVFWTILAGMMIPYQMLIFPLYKLITFFNLMNKLQGVITIETAINIPFAVFLFTGFIRTIPFELEESAHIDGCSPFRTFWKIVFPLLKPVIATVAIIDSMSTWNDFLTPLLFLQSRKNSVLLLEVFRNIGQFTTDYFSMLPMLMLSIAPLLIFYIFMQKYIIKGVISGSLKG